MKHALTLQQWIDSDNQRCPHCGSNNLFVCDPQGEHQQCHAESYCHDCEAHWYAVYGLTNCADLVVDDFGSELEDPDKPVTHHRDLNELSNLLETIDKQRAALQTAYDELGKHSRWNVSDLRLNVIKPLL